jgi:integrase
VKDPIRQCLHVEAWPALDQEAWARMTSADDFFDESASRAAHWRGPTRQRVRQAYGRWIAFLIGVGRLNPDTPPADRISPEAVKDYVLMLQIQIAPWTVWTYLLGLHQVARAFAPDRDWTWLYRITARLKARRRAVREKAPRMRQASEIAACAAAEMARLEGEADRRPSAAIRYRDALMVALLINCPVRLRNLTMIEIGRHLRQVGDGYALFFSPEEVKTRRYLRMAVSDAVAPYLRTWLDVWRPLLSKDDGCSALWLGVTGRPMTGRGVYQGVIRATERAVGAAINPHLFRDIAATSTAMDDPTHIGIAGPILGHTNPKTTEAHYIHADQIKAGRRHRGSVTLLRRELAPLLRSPDKSRTTKRLDARKETKQ